jgi:hypothetical protein
MASANMIVKPTNKIVLDSIGLHKQVMKIETVANMYAGRTVIAGTNDDDCQVGTTASEIIGFLGYEQTHKLHRPATVDTIYLVNAQASIIWGPGTLIVASLSDGVTAVKGTLLTPGLVGTLTGGVAGTDDIVATAEETVSTAAGPVANADCVVKLRV